MRACARYAITIALASAAAAGAATAAPPAPQHTTCDKVIAYVDTTGGHSRWRVLDPRTGADTLLFAMAGDPDAILWDASRTHVEYSVGNSVYRAEWRVGATPALIAHIPDSIEVCNYRFRADSNRWEVYTLRELGRMTWSSDSVNDACAYGTWTSVDGLHWTHTSADTAECEEPDCGAPHRRFDVAPGFSGPDEVLAPIGPEGQNINPDSQDSFERYFVPNAPGSSRGVEITYFWATTDAEPVCAPVSWVDHATGARRTLCEPSAAGSLESVRVTESCGLALVASMNGTLLVDLDTGRDFRALPAGGTSFLWVPIPRP